MEFIKYDFPRAPEYGSDVFMMQLEHHILKSRREQLGLTQQQVADKAKIQIRQYQRLESGERSISSASMRIGLCVLAVLKLNPYSFFPEAEAMNK